MGQSLCVYDLDALRESTDAADFPHARSRIRQSHDWRRNIDPAELGASQVAAGQRRARAHGGGHVAGEIGIRSEG